MKPGLDYTDYIFSEEGKMAFNEPQMSDHERMLASMNQKRAKYYKDDLENELSEITEKRLKILAARDRYLEQIDRSLATLDQRQKEIVSDIHYIEGLYFPDVNEDFFIDGLPHF